MKQKNNWLDLLIVVLFAMGICGACASLAAGAFKIHPVAGCFVVSIEFIIAASVLHDIKDR